MDEDEKSVLQTQIKVENDEIQENDYLFIKKEIDPEDQEVKFPGTEEHTEWKEIKHECKDETNSVTFEITEEYSGPEPNVSKDSSDIRCFYCKKVFKHSGVLLRHMNSAHRGFPHHYEGDFIECQLCLKKFEGVLNLELHVELEHKIEKSKIECNLCGKKCKQLTYLKRHMKFHLDERPFKCDICSDAFRTKHHKLRHIQVVHEAAKCKRTGPSEKLESKKNSDNHNENTQNSEWICSICTKKLPSEKALWNHKRCHKETILMECDICLESLKLKGDSGNLKRHLMNVHQLSEGAAVECIKGMSSEKVQKEITESKIGILSNSSPAPNTVEDPKFPVPELIPLERKFRCFYCERDFVLKPNLFRHIKYSHRGFPRWYLGGSIQCQLCEVLFENVNNLNNHVRTHHPVEKPKFECHHCGSKWDKLFFLKRHMACHTRERPFQCEVCSKTYKSEISLYNHKKIIHATDNLECPECFKSFKTKKYLKTHMVSHSPHGEGGITCPICGKACNTASHLKNHMKIHSNEKPYECPICKVRFKRTDSLNRHIKRHKSQKVKKFDCEFCGEKFMYANELNMHLVCHGYLQCEKCPKTLKGTRQLQRHIANMHSGESSSCPICGKAFIGKNSFSNHLRLHNQPTRFECPICSKTGKRKGDLVDHIVRVHNFSKEAAMDCFKDRLTEQQPEEICKIVNEKSENL